MRRLSSMSEHGGALMGEGKSYSDQLLLAFLFTATNMVGVGLLALLYFNILMFWPYVSAFFWAVVLSLVLRKPRNKIVECLLPLQKIENAYKDDWAVLVYIEKTKLLLFKGASIFSNSNTLYMLVSFVVVVAAYAYINSYFLPFHLLLVSCSVGVVSILFLLVIPDTKTFAAGLLVTMILLGSGTVIIFSATRFVEEGRILLLYADAALKGASQNRHVELMRGMEWYQVMDYVLLSFNDTAARWNITRFHSGLNSSSFSGSSSIGDFIVANRSLSDLSFGSDWAVTARDITLQIVNWLLGSGLFALNILTWFSASFYHIGISIFLSMTLIFLLLKTDTEVLRHMLELLPVQNTKRVYDQISAAFNGIFLTTFAVCCIHAFSTYAFLRFIIPFEFPFFYAFASAVTTLFPVLSAWVVHAPLIVLLWWRSAWSSMVVLVVLLVALSQADVWMYGKVPYSHPWVNGLSVVMGLYAFGIQGILLGPLIVCLTMIIYQVFAKELQNVHGPANTLDSPQ